MSYYTEFNPYLDTNDSTPMILFPEIIPTLAPAKTEHLLKKSIPLSNTKKCCSCKKRIRRDLVFCPFCGEKNTKLSFWSTITDAKSNQLNQLQNEIIFAPAGFKTDVFHPYKDIKSLKIQATRLFSNQIKGNEYALTLIISIPKTSSFQTLELTSSNPIELFNLINSACANGVSFNQSTLFRTNSSMDSFSLGGLSGIEFEDYCADLLRGLGYGKVKKTAVTGDQGVDIVAEKDSVRYAIQCKCYNSPIGNNAIQEVFAGIKYYNCDTGIVMTNSTFTRSAKELAECCQIDLWDGSELKRKKDLIFLSDRSSKSPKNTSASSRHQQNSIKATYSDSIILSQASKRRKKRKVLSLSLLAIMAALACSLFFVFRIPSVQKISVAETNVNLSLDGTYWLSYTIEPEKANSKKVTWRSSDSHIATVDDYGHVVAQNPGTCAITGTIDNQTVKIDISVSALKAAELLVIGRWTEDYVISGGVSSERRSFSLPLSLNDDLSGQYTMKGKTHHFVWSFYEKDSLYTYGAKNDNDDAFLIMYIEENDSLALAFEKETIYFYKRP